jgi:hypothetical protein
VIERVRGLSAPCLEGLLSVGHAWTLQAQDRNSSSVLVCRGVGVDTGCVMGGRGVLCSVAESIHMRPNDRN